MRLKCVTKCHLMIVALAGLSGSRRGTSTLTLGSKARQTRYPTLIMKTESDFVRLFPKPHLFQNPWNCSTRRLAICAFLFLVASLFSTFAEKLQMQILYSFPTPPVHPQSRLVQGVDGSFYGTSAEGGRHGL